MSPWIALATLAALLFYFFTGLHVARVRTRHQLWAPAMSGHPEVERALRVQGNTLEWIVIFVPCLWLWGFYLDPRIGALIALVWIGGRYAYLTGYMKDAAKRAPGFYVQTTATAVLFVGALVAAVANLSRSPLPARFF
jgi:glutathione S-transferase